MSPIEEYQAGPKLDPADRRKFALNLFVDNEIPQNLAYPPELLPTAPINGSAGVAQFYLLDDKKTGVLGLGSFSGSSFQRLQYAMLAGLLNLKAQGATQLVIDVVCVLSSLDFLVC